MVLHDIRNDQGRAGHSIDPLHQSDSRRQLCYMSHQPFLI